MVTAIERSHSLRFSRDFWIALLAVALGLLVGGLVVGAVPPLLGLILFGLALGPALIFVLQRNIFAGVILLLVVGSFSGAFKKMAPGLPTGMMIDGLALVLFGLVSLRKIVSERSPIYLSWLSVLILLFALVTVSELLNIKESTFENSVFGLRFIAIPITMCFVGMASIRNQRQAVVLLLSMLGIGALVGIYSVLQFFIGPLPFEQAWVDSSTAPNWYVAGQLRAFGPMEDFGTLASYAQILVTLGWALTLPHFPKWLRLSALPLFALSGAALLLTFVRASWFGGVVGICVVTFWPDRFLLRKLAQLALVALVVGGAFLAVDAFTSGGEFSVQRVFLARMGPLLENLAGGTLEEEGSFKDRLETWSDIIPMVQRSPFGIGLGTTGGVSQRFEGELGFIPADNYYVKLVLETGLAGLFLFIGILLLAIGKGAGLAFSTRNPQIRGLSIAITAVIVGLGVSAFFSSILDFVPTSYYFWLLLGVLASIQGLKDGGPAS